MLNREEALSLVKDRVITKNLIKHMLACEACLRALATHLNQNEEIWGLVGLLHDLDYEETKDVPSIHAKRTVEILKEQGADLPNEIFDAILAHNEHREPQTPLDWGLYAVDPTSGFLVACALMHPDKKLKAIDVDSCLRRFKEKHFAEGAKREQIDKCEMLGLSREEFLNICLDAMNGISDELGL
ncbi:MAG: HD domain-containing protein [bacterium]